MGDLRSFSVSQDLQNSVFSLAAVLWLLKIPRFLEPYGEGSQTRADVFLDSLQLISVTLVVKHSFTAEFQKL